MLKFCIFGHTDFVALLQFFYFTVKNIVPCIDAMLYFFLDKIRDATMKPFNMDVKFTHVNNCHECKIMLVIQSTQPLTLNIIGEVPLLKLKVTNQYQNPISPKLP